MSLPDIRTLVPHSGQMVLLDRVVSADTDDLCAEVRIHAGSMLANEGGVGGLGRHRIHGAGDCRPRGLAGHAAWR